MASTMQLEFTQAMTDFKTMFPDMDDDVIEAVLRANQGAVDATIDQLLAMSTDNQNERLRLEMERVEASTPRRRERRAKPTASDDDTAALVWLRLPFGLSSSPEIFQQKLMSLLKDLQGIEVIADDILIYGVGDTYEEAVKDHNIKFEKLLQRLREINCKLNKEKVNLLQTSVKFYGHILTSNGLKVDMSKVEAITKMPTPTSSKDVLRFLGMIGYLGKFLKNLSAQATNLRKLTRKDVEFIWTDVEEKEFLNLKKLIKNLPTLRYFDVNKEVIIECDASEFGLGAALYQDDQVICFASRCLTPTEKKYAQIEKEMLAVVFACKRFNQYVAGNCKTVIKTDHRPLINIMNKPLIEAPKRLQMMLLTLQKYNVELKFIKGKDNIVADTLSRAPICEKTDDYDLESKIKERKIFKLISKVSIIKYLKISDKLLEKIKEETLKDKELLQLTEYIINGFPKYISNLPDQLKDYHKYHRELSTMEGMIFRNNQVLIPTSLRQEMLQKIHTSHNGVASSLRLARENIFWPGMSLDIKTYVEKCLFCAKNLPCQQKLPLISHDIPVYPFQYISMDVFSVGDLKYLVTVDHYSDFFELDKISSLTASEIIQVCKRNFARHGIPQLVCTDNATNFNNEYFKNFASQWNFEHVTSSPHHPQSNGKAEATVKIAKRLVLQSLETKQDLWYCLLHRRNVPIEMDGTSPAQKLFSRRTRTSLPYLLEHLKPNVIPNVPAKIKERKEKVKEVFDKRSKDLPDLCIGQSVVIQLQPEISKKWSLGTVTKLINNRSYVVRVENKEYRRDRVHIRPYAGDCDPLVLPIDRQEAELPVDEQVPNDVAGFHLTTTPTSLLSGSLLEDASSSVALENSELTSGAANMIPESTRRSGRTRHTPHHLRDYVL